MLPHCHATHVPESKFSPLTGHRTSLDLRPDRCPGNVRNDVKLPASGAERAPPEVSAKARLPVLCHLGPVTTLLGLDRGLMTTLAPIRPSISTGVLRRLSRPPSRSQGVPTRPPCQLTANGITDVRQKGNTSSLLLLRISAPAFPALHLPAPTSSSRTPTASCLEVEIVASPASATSPSSPP